MLSCQSRTRPSLPPLPSPPLPSLALFLNLPCPFSCMDAVCHHLKTLSKLPHTLACLPMMDEWWRPEVGPFGFSGADAAVPRWLTAALCVFPADWHMDEGLPPKEVVCYVALKEMRFCIVEQVDQKRRTWKIPLCEFIVGHKVLASGDGHALTLRGTMLVINFDPWQYTRSDDSPQLCADMLSCARQDEAELAKFLAELWVSTRSGLATQEWIQITQAKRLFEKGRLTAEAYRSMFC